MHLLAGTVHAGPHHGPELDRRHLRGAALGHRRPLRLRRHPRHRRDQDRHRVRHVLAERHGPRPRRRARVGRGLRAVLLLLRDRRQPSQRHGLRGHVTHRRAQQGRLRRQRRAARHRRRERRRLRRLAVAVLRGEHPVPDPGHDGGRPALRCLPGDDAPGRRLRRESMGPPRPARLLVGPGRVVASCDRNHLRQPSGRPQHRRGAVRDRLDRPHPRLPGTRSEGRHRGHLRPRRPPHPGARGRPDALPDRHHQRLGRGAGPQHRPPTRLPPPPRSGPGRGVHQAPRRRPHRQPGAGGRPRRRRRPGAARQRLPRALRRRLDLDLPPRRHLEGHHPWAGRGVPRSNVRGGHRRHRRSMAPRLRVRRHRHPVRLPCRTPGRGADQRRCRAPLRRTGVPPRVLRPRPLPRDPRRPPAAAAELRLARLPPPFEP